MAGHLKKTTFFGKLSDSVVMMFVDSTGIFFCFGSLFPWWGRIFIVGSTKIGCISTELAKTQSG